MFGCRQQRHSAHMAQFERRLRIDRMKHFLDGNRIRPMLADQRMELAVHQREPDGQCVLF